jgi:hypothetical protein
MKKVGLAFIFLAFIYFLIADYGYTSYGSISENCIERSELFILGNYAPDDLSMWDDNPNNDPLWQKPAIYFEESKKEEGKKVTISLKTTVYDEEWEAKCTLKKKMIFFIPRYKLIDHSYEYPSD